MLVIIHGWSDDSTSFERLGNLLVREGVADRVTHVRLGNYISMDDEVRMDDIVAALNTAWENEPALSWKARSVDVIVHSTGGLVVRHWLSQMPPEAVPIKRLVMLAPANFGSPLAHTGRSFIGRVAKGWKRDKPFQTGTHVLKALELASPYSWDLAFDDRFTTKQYYGPGRILCTVLVGNTGYSGISALANKPGTDGTVRLSTANLNCAYLEADFSDDPLAPVTKSKGGKGQTAFGVMDGENHSTVAAKQGGPENDATLPAIVAALRVTDKGFPDWCQEMDAHTSAVMAAREDDGRNYHGFQHTVFKVQDQFGNAVDDYVIELYLDEKSKASRNARVTRQIQEDVIVSVHAYGDDSSMRSMLIDCDALYGLLDKKDEKLKISLTAHPVFGDGNDVGYRTFTDSDIGNIELSHAQVRNVFQANRALLVKIVLKRYQSGSVFEFKKLKKK
ncbi:MAG: alpha/beta hydrolase [Gammaproteobacteria bacterium]